MPRQYSIKTFLRQVRREMLEKYFRKRQIPFDVGFYAGKPDDIDRLYERLLQLPSEVLKKVELDLATIGQMATPAGTHAMLREAQIYGVEQAPVVFQMARNHHERSLWVFLDYPNLFHQASMCCHMDNFGAGRWRRRFVGKGLAVSLEAGVISELQKQIQNLYRPEGRAERCQIDSYVRQDPQRYCFFVYPEDHATSELGFGEGNLLCQMSRRLAFEVIFVYRVDDGVVELLAPGGKEYIDDLANSFAFTVLGLEELPPQSQVNAFNLELLTNRSFAFRTLPEERVESIYICEVTIKLPGPARKRITLGASPNVREPNAIHNVIDEYLNRERLFSDEIEIAAARIRMQFFDDRGERVSPLHVSLSLPDKADLKDDVYDQVARRILQRSGIILDPAAAQAPVSGGSAPGYCRLAG